MQGSSGHSSGFEGRQREFSTSSQTGESVNRLEYKNNTQETPAHLFESVIAPHEVQNSDFIMHRHRDGRKPRPKNEKQILQIRMVATHTKKTGKAHPQKAHFLNIASNDPLCALWACRAPAGVR